MKLWPFGSKLETRSESVYSDAVIAGIVARATGAALAIPSATAALESCAGVVGRGFANAEVHGRGILAEALTPDCLELVGRSLIRRGELVMLIDTTGGRLTLLPAEQHDVTGGPFPHSWEYQLSIAGPSTTMTYHHVSAQQVLHFRYAADAARPWRGNGPIEIATLAGTLSAETVRSLSEEVSGPVGRLLGVPKDGGDDSVKSLKTDIATAKGRVALLETGDWADAGGGKVELKSQRFGPEPPDGMVSLLEAASREIFAACGFSPSLFAVGPAAALREAWRLALFGVLAPLATKVSAEFTAKLGGSMMLSFEELKASDLSGRARAFQSMVGGGMDAGKAASLSGLTMPED